MKISYNEGILIKQNLSDAIKVATPFNFAENKIKNKKYFTEFKYALKLSQTLENELKNETIKQEFLSQFNSVFENEKKNFVKENLNTNPYILEQNYKAQIKKAKITYFQRLFEKQQGNTLRVADGKNLEEIANHAVLRREVLNNDTFVALVIEKLEKKEPILQKPSSVVEQLASDLYGIYNFNLVEELGNVVAKEKATDFVNKLFENANPYQVAKVEKSLAVASEVVDTTISVNKAINTSNVFKNPFDKITRRFGNILTTVNHEMNGLQNSVLTESYDSVFGKKFAKQTNVKPIGSVYIPLVISEYSDEFSLIYKNNIAIEKLNKDINTMLKIEKTNNKFEFDLTGKNAEIKFYKMATEFVYDSIYIKETQKAIKSVIGNVTSQLLMENENFLTRERIAFANNLVENVVPNCSPEFIKQIVNTVSQLDKTNEFSFENYCLVLKDAIIKNSDDLYLTGRVNVENYAERVVQAIQIAVEEKEQSEDSYYNSYIENISKLKQNINAKRVSELAMTYHDYGVLNETLRNQVNNVKNVDKDLVSKQEKSVLAYHKILNKQMLEVNNKLEDIVKLYSGNEEKMSGFVVSYVNGITKEFAKEVNPKIRNATLQALAKPLISNNIIEDISELKKPVEVLAKRINPNYEKIDNQIKGYKEVISIKDIANLPTIKPREVAKKQVKEVVLETEKEVKKPEKAKEEVVSVKKEIAEKVVVEPSKEVKTKVVVEKVVNPEPIKAEVKPEPKQEKVEFKKEVKQIVETVHNIKGKTMAEHFKKMDELNLALIDADALTYMVNENNKEKLENVDELGVKERTALLKEVLKDSPKKNLLLDTNAVEEQVLVAKTELEQANKQLLKKYSKTTEDEKIAFVVLALNKQNDLEKQVENVRTYEDKVTETYRVFNLDDKKEFMSCKNDIFWKLQLNAVKNNVVLEKSLNDETMEEFKQVAPVVKLFEIAAGDNTGLSDVSINGIGQLNYQQLARVSILKYKDGKINDPNTVSLVNHILTNTSAYSKSPEYNEVVEGILNSEDVKNEFKNGLISVDKLIEREVKEGGRLKDVLNNFYKKTTPTLPKLVKITKKEEENTNITI